MNQKNVNSIGKIILPSNFNVKFQKIENIPFYFFRSICLPEKSFVVGINKYVKTARLYDEKSDSTTEFVIAYHKTVDNTALYFINDTDVRDSINKTHFSESSLKENTFDCWVIFF